MVDLPRQIGEGLFETEKVALLLGAIVFVFVQVALVNGVDKGRILFFSGDDAAVDLLFIRGVDDFYFSAHVELVRIVDRTHFIPALLFVLFGDVKLILPTELTIAIISHINAILGLN